MIKILYIIILISVTNISYSQKKKGKNIYPESTSSIDRNKGYKDRKSLEENSLVKNIKFKNIGPSVMSGRVVDLDVTQVIQPIFMLLMHLGDFGKQKIMVIHSHHYLIIKW